MNDDEQIVWQGRFITTKTRGKWEYVSRARGIKAAGPLQLARTQFSASPCMG